MSPKDIEDFRNGDDKAFGRLYSESWAKVYNFAGLFLDDEFEKEDVVQEVFLRLWRKRILIDGEKDFDGYLFITTRNLVFNRLRSSGRMYKLEAVLENIPEGEHMDSSIDASYLKNSIDKLVEMLPDRQRETFLLSRKQGLSIKEISKIMEISESGVKRNLNLALKFIKSNLPLLLLFYKIL